MENCVVGFACKDTGAEYLVEHDDGDADLEGRGPDHVDVGHEVGNALAVHRHQVHDLPRGGVLPRTRGHAQALPVNICRVILPD